MNANAQLPGATIAALVILSGVGATLVVDGWALLRRRLFGTRVPDYALIGRWLVLMRRGQFRHEALAREAPVRGESGIGWTFHYLIGIAFAGLPFAMLGQQWFREPSLVWGLGVGALTVIAPFFILQPALGAGIAASRTPDPATARFQSLITHLVFGAGLFGSASVLSLLVAPG
jgi:hypothetical protein